MEDRIAEWDYDQCGLPNNQHTNHKLKDSIETARQCLDKYTEKREIFASAEIQEFADFLHRILEQEDSILQSRRLFEYENIEVNIELKSLLKTEVTDGIGPYAVTNALDRVKVGLDTLQCTNTNSICLAQYFLECLRVTLKQPLNSSKPIQEQLTPSKDLSLYNKVINTPSNDIISYCRADTSFRNVKTQSKIPASKLPSEEYLYTHQEHDVIRAITKETFETTSFLSNKLIHFPMKKPSLSQQHLNLLEFWTTQRSLKALNVEKNLDLKHKVAAMQTIYFLENIYEASRFIFERCPTTSRVLHSIASLASSVLQKNGILSFSKNNRRDLIANGDLEVLKLKEQRAKLNRVYTINRNRRRNTQAEKLAQCLNNAQSAIKLLHQLIDRTAKEVYFLSCSLEDLLPRNSLSTTSKYLAHEAIAKLGCIVLGLSNFDLMQNLLTKQMINWTNRKRQESKMVMVSSKIPEVCMLPEKSENAFAMPGNELDHADILIQKLKREAKHAQHLMLPQSMRSDTELQGLPLENFQLLRYLDHDLSDLEEQILHVARCVENLAMSTFHHRSMTFKVNAKLQTDRSFLRVRQCFQRVVEHRLQKKSKNQSNFSSKLAITLQDAKDESKCKSQVPQSFKKFIKKLPMDYKSVPIGLHDVHISISWIFNELLLAGKQGCRVLVHSEQNFQLELVAKSIHRTFLHKFRIPIVANTQLLDLLMNVQQLDTQSTKILVFARLLQLPGLDPLPPRSFWFLVDFLSTLQCKASKGYFSLNSSGEEIVSQTTAWDVLSESFAHFHSELLDQLKSKLSSLASVCGAIKVPLYKVISFALDEWVDQYKRLLVQLDIQLGDKISRKSITFQLVDNLLRGINPDLSSIVTLKAFRKMVTISKGRVLDSSHCSAICISLNILPAEDQSVLARLVPNMTENGESVESYQATINIGLAKMAWARLKRNKLLIEHRTRFSSIIDEIEISLVEGCNGTKIWEILQHILYQAYSGK